MIQRLITLRMVERSPIHRKGETSMNYKFFLVLLYFISMCQAADIQQLGLAIERRDTVLAQTYFNHFFTRWKNGDDLQNSKQIAADTKLYQLCLDALNNFPLTKYTNLSIAERNKLTDSEKSQIKIHRIMFAIIAVGYLEKNPIANNFAEKLKSESNNSKKSKALFEIWNETLDSFRNEKFAVEAKRIVNGKNILSYFISRLKDQKYLNDVKSQYVLTAISSQPELLTKDKLFGENKELIITLLEQQFDQLPKDPENIHDKTWRGQQSFIMLHQSFSSPPRHSDWIKKIIQEGKISSRLKSRLPDSHQ